MNSKNKGNDVVTVLLMIAIIAATLTAVSFIADNRGCKGTACVIHISENGTCKGTACVTPTPPTPTPIQTPTPVATYNPNYGFLSVKSVPIEADITVSGGHYGITNRDGTNPIPGQAGSLIQLAPGTYNIVLSKAGYQTYTKTITIVKGQTSSVSVSLVAG